MLPVSLKKTTLPTSGGTAEAAMAPSRSSSLPFLFSISVLFLAAAHLCAATDHIVGGHLGWNPNINYTDWVNNQTFYVNDLISFRYQKNTYNVFEVNQTGYDNCTMEGAAGNWSSGKDFILLDHSGRYYFICGTGLCSSGMKISVFVHPLPSPPASHTPLSEHSKSSSSGAAAAAFFGSSFAGALAAALAVSAAWLGI